MPVKAKFHVSSVKHFFHTGAKSTGAQVELSPVISGSEENKTWSQYTPSGKIEMYISNPDAVAQFEQGGEFYVTFEKAE